MDKYDIWKLTPPEDYKAHADQECTWCRKKLYYDDEYWDLDSDVLCEDCAQEWLETKKHRIV